MVWSSGHIKVFYLVYYILVSLSTGKSRALSGYSIHRPPARRQLTSPNTIVVIVLQTVFLSYQRAQGNWDGPGAGWGVGGVGESGRLVGVRLL